jgi:cardiolipin-specific phospholipase
MKELSNHFNVYSIDLPGQALSSRPPFECQTPEEIVDFFTNSIEQWRQQLKIKQLTLVGHSFGGYIAAFYALQYPERIRDLVLISPAGVKDDGI